MDHKPRVLLFSTGDSTRSQMAEGFLRTLAGDEIIPVSTAVQSVEPDPLTSEVMNEVGVDISGQHAKEIAESFREHFSYVITVCDASREKFPIWPFTHNVFHWSLADPERVLGSVDQKRQMFRTVRDDIRRKAHNFLTQIRPQLRPG